MRTLLLLVAVLFPPALYTIAPVSSMAPGVLSASCFCVFVYLLTAARRQTANLITCFGVTLAALSTVAILGLASLDADRFMASFAILAALFFGAFAFANIGITDRAIRRVFYVLVITGLCGAVGVSPFARQAFIQPVLFFSERSHFALSFLPFMLYMAITSQTGLRKLSYLATGIVLALLLTNLTLLVGTAIAAFVALQKRYSIVVGAAAAVAIYAVPMTGSNYYTERIALSRDSKNASALAYLNGWQHAYAYLVSTNGIGVGFQQFGADRKATDLDYEIEATTGKRLNERDGSTVGAKLIGEFGALGIILLAAYLAILPFHIKRLPQDPFFRSCIVMYAMDLFVRGTGYFSPTAFLFLTAMYALLMRRRSRESQTPSLSHS